LGSS
jgi:hypothetical protein